MKNKVTKSSKNANRNIKTPSWKYIGGALLTAAVIGASAYLLSPSKISFQQAKEDPSKRVAYISNLVKKIEISEYLDSITYVPHHIERGEEGGAYQKRFGELATRALGGTFKEVGQKKTHSRTEIYDMAFETARNEREFLNKIDHEKNIASSLYHGFTQAPLDSFKFTDSEGKPKVNTILLQVICELESYGSDLESATRRGMDSEYIEDLRSNYLHHYKTLFAQGLIGDSNKINRLRTIYFRDWMKSKK